MTTVKDLLTVRVGSVKVRVCKYEEEILDSEAAAAELGTTSYDLDSRARAGEIPSLRIGDRYFYPLEEVTYLDSIKKPGGFDVRDFDECRHLFSLLIDSAEYTREDMVEIANLALSSTLDTSMTRKRAKSIMAFRTPFEIVRRKLIMGSCGEMSIMKKVITVMEDHEIRQRLYNIGSRRGFDILDDLDLYLGVEKKPFIKKDGTIAVSITDDDKREHFADDVSGIINNLLNKWISEDLIRRRGITERIDVFRGDSGRSLFGVLATDELRSFASWISARRFNSRSDQTDEIIRRIRELASR